MDDMSTSSNINSQSEDGTISIEDELNVPENNKDPLKESEKKIKFDFVRDEPDHFTENEERKIFAVRDKANIYREKIENATISPEKAQEFVDDEIKKLKAEWPALFGAPIDKIYVHVDLDSFYASVETLKHPEYKDIPIGVGSNLMLAACNYKAREYGVRSGMPGYHAKSLCPQLQILRINFDEYNYYSEIVMEILSAYDPGIEIYGIDEACLIFDEDKLIRAYEFYNTNKRNGRSTFNQNKAASNTSEREGIDNNIQWDPLSYKEFSIESVNELIEKVRAVVFRNTGLTISAGISVCRGFAKFSSKINKPNGQFFIENNFDSHILDLEVDEINGIGVYTKEALEKTLKIKTIRDLRENLKYCAIIFKSKGFNNLLRLSYGLSLFDNPGHEKKLRQKAKSHGVGMSFAPTADHNEILTHLWNFSAMLARRMNKSKQCGQTLTVMVKYLSFRSITRRKKGLKIIQDDVDIFNTAFELLNKTYKRDPKTNFWGFDDLIRMIGLSVSDLLYTSEIEGLNKYKTKNSSFKPRTCIVCNCVFLHESRVEYQNHVNLCLDRVEAEEKKRKNTIEYLFSKHKK